MLVFLFSSAILNFPFHNYIYANVVLTHTHKVDLPWLAYVHIQYISVRCVCVSVCAWQLLGRI